MTAALLPAPNDESRPPVPGAAGRAGCVSNGVVTDRTAAGTGQKRRGRPYLVPVPDCEPPFDDEAARCPHHGRTDCGADPEPLPRFQVRHGAWHAPGRSSGNDRVFDRPTSEVTLEELTELVVAEYRADQPGTEPG